MRISKSTRTTKCTLICLIWMAFPFGIGWSGEPWRGDFKQFHPMKYRRPFGSEAPWNIPVKKLPRHPQSDLYTERLWNHATASRPGNFNLTFDGYTYPVYLASNAEDYFPVTTKWKTNINGKTIPWNRTWRPPHGTDAQVIIVDLKKGLEWDLWQVRFDQITVHATNGNLVQAGIDGGDGSTPANIWEKENGFRPSRGCGIQYLAMLVRPEEIMQGSIKHALSMPIRNTDGKVFVPPATKLEHPNFPGNRIPEGMRFALDVTDSEIEEWINSLPDELPPVTKNSARVIAVALRDYGWFITDTSGGAHLQFESHVTAGDKWKALGLEDREIQMKEYPRDLLDGLIQKEIIHAIVPSDQYCWK